MPVAGLPLGRRIALAAGRAGFGEVLLAGGQGTTGLAPRRIVALGGHVVPQPAWLRALLAMPLPPETLYVDEGAVAIIETEEPGRVLAAAARCGGLEELAHALEGGVAIVRRPLEPSGRFALRGAADVPAAEAWLLRGLIKPSEGFMSRHVERRISLALTRRLASTSITPNAMTLISLAVGFSGAALFLLPAWQLAAALLFLAHSILDGCDGELARLKFLESARGAALDFWGDNLVHAAVFAGMAVGWSIEARALWPLGVGAAAVVSTAVVAVAAYRRDLIARPPADGAATSSRVVEALAHRDFIYLIVLLAAAGKAYWFIALTAVGAPAFLLLLLWSGRPPRTT